MASGTINMIVKKLSVTATTNINGFAQVNVPSSRKIITLKAVSGAKELPCLSWIYSNNWVFAPINFGTGGSLNTEPNTEFTFYYEYL